jgi:predicted DNA-binding protein (MmcQ/YjbR family)
MRKRPERGLKARAAVMTRQELIDFCLTFPGVYEDYPFDGLWAVMRHRANKKSFAFIYELEGRLCVNLKCEPEESEFLRSAFQDVTPAYHMNKTHWNTVRPDGDVPEDETRRMAARSYDLTKPEKAGAQKTGSARGPQTRHAATGREADNLGTHSARRPFRMPPKRRAGGLFPAGPDEGLRIH